MKTTLRELKHAIERAECSMNVVMQHEADTATYVVIPGYKVQMLDYDIKHMEGVITEYANAIAVARNIVFEAEDEQIKALITTLLPYYESRRDFYQSLVLQNAKVMKITKCNYTLEDAMTLYKKFRTLVDDARDRIDYFYANTGVEIPQTVFDVLNN